MAKTDHRLPVSAGGASLTRPSATQPLLSAAPREAITSWLSAVASFSSSTGVPMSLAIAAARTGYLISGELD